jgi:hypothetical protein
MRRPEYIKALLTCSLKDFNKRMDDPFGDHPGHRNGVIIAGAAAVFSSACSAWVISVGSSIASLISFLLRADSGDHTKV